MQISVKGEEEGCEKIVSCREKSRLMSVQGGFIAVSFVMIDDISCHNPVPNLTLECRRNRNGDPVQRERKIPVQMGEHKAQARSVSQSFSFAFGCWFVEFSDDVKWEKGRERTVWLARGLRHTGHTRCLLTEDELARSAARHKSMVFNYQLLEGERVVEQRWRRE